MKRTLSLLLMMMLGISSALTVCAEEKITVNANSTEISDGLDLRAVANLFAESKNLEAFEKALNDPKESYTNLDLNGDGQVDYIRVIETTESNKHIVVLQAVLAKDIYQDVATIIVEGDSNNASIRIEGDERIYGANYVIEPVYYYRPAIYDWFWGPSWYCWNSPYYWGGWPGWWAPYAPCPRVVYVERCCCCCSRSACSFRASESARVVRSGGSGRVTGSGAHATPSSGRTASAGNMHATSHSAIDVSSHRRTGVSTDRHQDLSNFTTSHPSSRTSHPSSRTSHPTSATSRATTPATSRATTSTSVTRPTTATASRPTSATITRTTTRTTQPTSRTASTSSSMSSNMRTNTTLNTGRSNFSGGSGFSGGGMSGGGSMGGGSVSHSSGAHSGAGRR